MNMMLVKRTIFFLIIFLVTIIQVAYTSDYLGMKIKLKIGTEKLDSSINPLSQYSVKWNDAKFNACNTAKSVKYLKEEEKNVIWVLNMIRLDPQLFLNSILMKANFFGQNKSSSYFTSLIADVKKLKPDESPLVYDSSAFVSARCHAIQAGKRGYVGHERTKSDCVEDFYAECCEYGNVSALNILINLLIDDGVESLGHRITCLSPNFDKLGVSIQPHKTYGTNTVMDFK
jgi:uncharacterized protein YkwD